MVRCGGKENPVPLGQKIAGKDFCHFLRALDQLKGRLKKKTPKKEKKKKKKKDKKNKTQKKKPKKNQKKEKIPHRSPLGDDSPGAPIK